MWPIRMLSGLFLTFPTRNIEWNSTHVLVLTTSNQETQWLRFAKLNTGRLTNTCAAVAPYNVHHTM